MPDLPKRSAVRKTGGLFNYAIKRWQHDLKDLVARAAVVAALDGYVTPFRHHVAEQRKRLGLFDFRWPRLQDAVDWLLGQQILIKDQLAKRIQDATKDQLGDFDIWASSINDQLRNELAQSVAGGESREEWAKRMDKASLGFAANAEAIGRTWMHRSYTQGTKESLADPVVGELFPYWLYESTNDARTRATHRAMGGKVAFRGSPLADEMERLANEYGCRCTLVPIRRDDAVAKGIDDDTGWLEPAVEDVPATDVAIASERDWEAELKDLVGNKKERQQKAVAILKDAPDDVIAKLMEDAAGHTKAAAHEVGKTRPSIDKMLGDRAIEDEKSASRRAAETEAKVLRQLDEAQALLLASGFSFDYQSDSKSRYFRRGAHQVRVSDHYVPMTAERTAAVGSGGRSWASGMGAQIILPTTSVGAEVSRIVAEVREAELELLEPSKAVVTIADDDKHAIDKQLRKLIGDASPAKLATVVGAPDDAAVNVTWNQSVSRVDIEHPKFHASVVLHDGTDGKKWIEYEYLRVDEAHQGTGIGTDVAAKQIYGAQKYGDGIEYVKLHAAGGAAPMEGFAGQYNGYYTWPRLGYDQPIADIAKSNPAAFDAIRAAWPDAVSVLDIMATPAGRTWWKIHGVELLDARFDLSPGSRSMQVLEAYLDERAKRTEGQSAGETGSGN